jgi:hypothetical protein
MALLLGPYPPASSCRKHIHWNYFSWYTCYIVVGLHYHRVLRSSLTLSWDYYWPYFLSKGSPECLQKPDLVPKSAWPEEREGDGCCFNCISPLRHRCCFKRISPLRHRCCSKRTPRNCSYKHISTIFQFLPS